MVRQTLMENGFDERMEARVTSKGLKTGPNPSSKEGVLTLNKSNPTSPNSKQWIEGLKCSHCRNSKHTQDSCFNLHGYLNWWNELQAKKKRNFFFLIGKDNSLKRDAKKATQGIQNYSSYTNLNTHHQKG